MSRFEGFKPSTRSHRRVRRASQPTCRRFAAIDIGSNSIRLVVAEAETDGSYRVLDDEREMARLGKGLTETGRLDRSAMRSALATLTKMRAIADGFRAEIRAVATSAVRDARNGQAFSRAVQERLGIRMEIISGREEGLLAFRSAARHFDLNDRSTAVVDIGGGSLEIVLAKGTLADEVHSLPLGTVRLSEEFVRSDPLRPRNWKTLRKEIDKTLKRAMRKPPFHLEQLIGSGGTFTALAQISKAERGEPPGSVQGFVLTLKDVTEILSRLRRAPLAERKRVRGLNPRRADIIVAGAAAVARTAKHLGVERILVNERGLRDGILLGMIEDRVRKPLKLGRNKLHDRIEWVRLLGRKCLTNERHSAHVARLAMGLFDGLEQAYKLSTEGRELLEAAALLHEVGILVNHEEHPKHAYHLILHSGLTGFSARELELIANIARYQNGGEPKKSHMNFEQLRPSDQRLVRQLSGILRIADALDRTQSQRITNVSARRSGDRVILVLTAEGAPQVEIWDAKRRARLFEAAFDAPLTFQWAGKARRRSGAAIVVRKQSARPRLKIPGSTPRPVRAGQTARTRR